MNHKIELTLSEETTTKANELAYDVLLEFFGMPFGASCRDYDNIDDLKKADAEAEVRNAAAVKLVVDTVISALVTSGNYDVVKDENLTFE
jgi:hypothetical protein